MNTQTYRNKSTGDIVEAKQHQLFPELQSVTFDSGIANTEPLSFDIPIGEFEQEYEMCKQRYFYIAYTATLKNGKSRKDSSFSITDGSHFNRIKFINSVKKYEKATRVIIDNFIEFKTEQDFKDFQRGDYEVFK